jgi:hypothetical protein
MVTFLVAKMHVYQYARIHEILSLVPVNNNILNFINAIIILTKHIFVHITIVGNIKQSR